MMCDSDDQDMCYDGCGDTSCKHYQSDNILKHTPPIRRTKKYSIEYICVNCTKRQHVLFPTGQSAPSFYTLEKCTNCGCNEFTKAIFQSHYF